MDLKIDGDFVPKNYILCKQKSQSNITSVNEILITYKFPSQLPIEPTALDVEHQPYPKWHELQVEYGCHHESHRLHFSHLETLA